MALSRRSPALAFLLRVGPLLYGRSWQEPIARDLGVSSRALRYWLTQEANTPQDVPQRLRPVIRKRVRDLVALDQGIEGGREGDD